MTAEENSFRKKNPTVQGKKENAPSSAPSREVATAVLLGCTTNF
jgi:hypothetical protein